MMGLTRKQLECLNFIRSYSAEHGIAPTLQEIAASLGTGHKSKAFYWVRSLEERGYIRRLAGRNRAIEIIERGAAVTLSPQVERAVSEYARRHRTTTQAAANELLAEYLAKVAA